MKRLFYPAERPLDGHCPSCNGLLTHIFVNELIDTALPWRDGNVRDAPRWICRRCWGVDEAANGGSTRRSVRVAGLMAGGSPDRSLGLTGGSLYETEHGFPEC